MTPLLRKLMHVKKKILCRTMACYNVKIVHLYYPKEVNIQVLVCHRSQWWHSKSKVSNCKRRIIPTHNTVFILVSRTSVANPSVILY